MAKPALRANFDPKLGYKFVLLGSSIENMAVHILELSLLTLSSVVFPEEQYSAYNFNSTGEELS